MQATILRIGGGIALLLTGYMVGTHTATSTHAQTMRGTVPPSYGRLVAGDSSSLWFEDNTGTLRQVTIPAGNTIYIVTR
ncbi:MAG: hypothetical protein WBA18_20545 [Terracidiphilus sp.]